MTFQLFWVPSMQLQVGILRKESWDLLSGYQYVRNERSQALAAQFQCLDVGMALESLLCWLLWVMDSKDC